MRVRSVSNSSVLEKIQKLEKLVENGEKDSIVLQTLDKLIFYEKFKYQQELKTLVKKLRRYENKYQLKTPEFARRFQSGELGDEADYFEWQALWRIYNRLNEKLEILKQ